VLSLLLAADIWHLHKNARSAALSTTLLKRKIYQIPWA